MALFGIYTPHKDMPQFASISDAERLAMTIAVKDQFSFWAFAFPTFWMLFKGYWVPLALFVTCQIMLFSGAYFIAGDNFEIYLPFLSLAITALSIGIGFEAHQIEAFSLSHKGYAQSALITGGSAEEAIAKYFDTVEATQKDQIIVDPSTQPGSDDHE